AQHQSWRRRVRRTGNRQALFDGSAAGAAALDAVLDEDLDGPWASERRAPRSDELDPGDRIDEAVEIEGFIARQFAKHEIQQARIDDLIGQEDAADEEV